MEFLLSQTVHVKRQKGFSMEFGLLPQAKLKIICAVYTIEYWFRILNVN
jgi:hypothetical protein